MRDFLARRPSPAMAVAFVALLAALSGTAIALPGTNTVDSGDIKNGQVKNKDIRNNAVTGKKVKNGTLGGADVKNDNLTGADINESTLGQVPSAATAGSANTANSANSANSANTANTANSANTANTAGSVGGVTFRSFNFTTQAAAPATEIFNFGGLVLTATCTGAVLDFSAATTVADAQLDSYSLEPDVAASPPQNLAFEADFDPGDTVDLVPDDEDGEVGSLRYTKLDGGGVHIQWHAYDQAAVVCGVNGVASVF
jgi:hypothetical protein